MYKVKVKIHKSGYRAIYIHGVFYSTSQKTIKDKKAFLMKYLQTDLSKAIGEDVSGLLFEIVEFKKIKVDFVIGDNV